jgi:hypothetical protein
MSFWSDMDYDMQPLDTDTADRLLAGAIQPEDAPPGYAELARVLRAASAETTAEELACEAEIVAMVAAAVRSSSSVHPSSSRRSYMPFALSRPRISAAIVAAWLACTVIGLASAGALPGAAQEIASTMLHKVGISIPGTNENAGTHPDVRGTSTVAPSETGTGSDISGLATSTDLSGIEKGAAISSVASDGKSQAGTHGGASGASAPVATPNGGGTGTADTASNGASSSGASTADTASGAHSTAGSSNADSGQSTADTASAGNSTAGQSHKP